MGYPPGDLRMKEARRRWYDANKAKVIAYKAEYKRNVRATIQGLKNQQPCTDCGVRYPHYVMDYDHLVAETKVAGVSRLGGYSVRKALEEIEKCELVCANCHRERTWQRSNSGDLAVV